MPGPRRRNDEERLPWLEPYREAAAARPAPAPRKKSRTGSLSISTIWHRHSIRCGTGAMTIPGDAS